MASILGLLGLLLYLGGTIWIATQVRVHQIEVYSPGSSLFRIGAILISIAPLLEPELWSLIARILGLFSIPIAALIGHHEWLQAAEKGATSINWSRTLAVQVAGIGVGIVHTAGLIGFFTAQ